jgi:hypothetical protein
VPIGLQISIIICTGVQTLCGAEVLTTNLAAVSILFGREGKLYIPGRRVGFDPHGIQGMFFRVQLVRQHEATCRVRERRIQQLEQDVAKSINAAMKYRRLVSNEARQGLMLEWIAGYGYCCN